MRRHGAVGPDLDAEALEIAHGAARERLAEGGQDARPGLDQDDARELGIDLAEVAREREAAHLADRARELDARRPAAHDHEREQRLLALGIRFLLGILEGAQHAAADLRRLLEGLEAGRVLFPVVVAEVRVLRAAGEHEHVVVAAFRTRW